MYRPDCVLLSGHLSQLEGSISNNLQWHCRFASPKWAILSPKDSSVQLMHALHIPQSRKAWKTIPGVYRHCPALALCQGLQRTSFHWDHSQAHCCEPVPYRNWANIHWFQWNDEKAYLLKLEWPPYQATTSLRGDLAWQWQHCLSQWLRQKDWKSVVFEVYKVLVMTELMIISWEWYHVMTDWSAQTAYVLGPHAICRIFHPLRSMKVLGYIVESPDAFSLPHAHSCPPTMHANEDVPPQAT